MYVCVCADELKVTIAVEKVNEFGINVPIYCNIKWI